jgi:hypothetical protein
MYNILSNGRASVFVMPCSNVETNGHSSSGRLICPCTKQIFHSGHVQILLLVSLHMICSFVAHGLTLLRLSPVLGMGLNTIE